MPTSKQKKAFARILTAVNEHNQYALLVQFAHSKPPYPQLWLELGLTMSLAYQNAYAAQSFAFWLGRMKPCSLINNQLFQTREARNDEFGSSTALHNNFATLNSEWRRKILIDVVNGGEYNIKKCEDLLMVRVRFIDDTSIKRVENIKALFMDLLHFHDVTDNEWIDDLKDLIQHQCNFAGGELLLTTLMDNRHFTRDQILSLGWDIWFERICDENVISIATLVAFLHLDFRFQIQFFKANAADKMITMLSKQGFTADYSQFRGTGYQKLFLSHLTAQQYAQHQYHQAIMTLLFNIAYQQDMPQMMLDSQQFNKARDHLLGMGLLENRHQVNPYLSFRQDQYLLEIIGKAICQDKDVLTDNKILTILEDIIDEWQKLTIKVDMLTKPKMLHPMLILLELLAVLAWMGVLTALINTPVHAGGWVLLLLTTTFGGSGYLGSLMRFFPWLTEKRSLIFIPIYGIPVVHQFDPSNNLFVTLLQLQNLQKQLNTLIPGLICTGSGLQKEECNQLQRKLSIELMQCNLSNDWLANRYPDDGYSGKVSRTWNNYLCTDQLPKMQGVHKLLQDLLQFLVIAKFNPSLMQETSFILMILQHAHRYEQSKIPLEPIYRRNEREHVIQIDAEEGTPLLALRR